MYCSYCDYEKVLKPISTTRKFDESGLDNITLKGVVEYKCPNCGEEFNGYSNLEQLHQLIAYHLVRKKGSLTNKEIRFLRKYMGYSSSAFAKVVGQQPEHISRLENGKNKVSPIFDRLIRALVIHKLPNRNYDLHDQLLNQTGEAYTRLEVKFKNNKWNVRLVA